ncbi:aminoacyl-tRNA hydrolase [Candidatus Shapirobacteria bacterium]|nr:aminoacyl-tRNA hydrolase [Candidatus Shapirobacteria bacterium]
MLIVGLGNPEDKYQNTRHNAGMMFMDFLADKWELKWKKRKDLLCFVAQKDGLFLAKPLTFMNESGKAVAKLVEKLKIEFKDLYLAHDELDLKLGEWKLTFGKSSPLHKGVLSVEQYLKTKEFWRLRIGVDNRDSQGRIEGEKYVLQDFPASEKAILLKLFKEISQPDFPACRLKRPEYFDRWFE